MVRLIFLLSVLVGLVMFYLYNVTNADNPSHHSPQVKLIRQNVDIEDGKRLSSYELPVKQQRVIINAIDSEQFEELEKALEGYFSEFEQAVQYEGKLIGAFNLISYNDLSHATEWVKQYPNSAYARLARGLAYHELGWRERGSKFRSETPGENFAKMKEQFALAKHDIEDALRINPKLSPAYCALIDIAAAGGERDDKLTIYKEGINHIPHSFNIRYCYLEKLKSRWGGSRSQMEGFVKLADVHLDKNPRMKLLSSYLSYFRGQSLYRARRYAESIEEFSDSISIGARWYNLRYRYFAYERMGEYDLALQDNQYALEVRPDVYVVLKDRIRILKKLKRYQQALDVVDYFMTIYDDEADILVKKGNVYWSMGNHQAAYDTFLAALALDPNNEDALFGKAKISYHQFNQPQQALDDMLRAFEISGSPFIWYEYASLQWYMKDKAAVISYRTYLEICKDTSCKKKNLSWTKEFLACVDKTPECTRPSEFDVSWTY